MAGKKPEHQAPPEIFYNEDEAAKYTSNTRIMQIQSEMSERALELLALPEDESCFLLDIGCGSGLSGDCCEELGHCWVGLDISQAMLDIARERESEAGDVLCADMGQSLPFRAGSFDGAISISALQWLCNADKSWHNPHKRSVYSIQCLGQTRLTVTHRLYKFFSSLYACLSRGSRAVLQFYPENPQQVEMITQQSMKAGFTGGLVVDYPNSTKAKKFFLVLMTGGAQPLPQALGQEEAQHSLGARFETKRERVKQIRGNKNIKKSRDWILDKKERARKKGRDVRPDTKYTGRKRRDAW